MDKHNTHASTVLASFFKNTSMIPGGVADNCYEGIDWGNVPLNQRPSKEQFEARKIEMDKQIPMNLLRQERDKRLADADWVTLRAYSSGTDVPEEWMTYMQALRDLPSVTKDPTNPVWPEPPNPSLVGEKMEKLAPRVSFLETSVASLISLDKQLNYKNAEMEILDIKVKNIESRLGMIEETLTSILSKLNI